MGEHRGGHGMGEDTAADVEVAAGAAVDVEAGAKAVGKATTEVWFYHLERAPLERVLPTLLERTLARGWRAVVQVGSKARLAELDELLWTYRDDSFLAHGTPRDGAAAHQPIYLTTGSETPNGAQVRFLVEGAEPGDLGPFERAILIFDGRDEAAREAARAEWRAAEAAGHSVTYWQQDEAGRWQQKK